MLTDLAMLGGVMVAVLGLMEAGERVAGGPANAPSGEAALRAAMTGPEAEAVRAEFRRRGICPRPRRGPVGFGG